MDWVHGAFLMVGSFAWGMWAQELATSHKHIKAREHRVIINAPFSPDQADTIMKALQEINEAAGK